jgi:hypothetical protein
MAGLFSARKEIKSIFYSLEKYNSLPHAQVQCNNSNILEYHAAGYPLAGIPVDL